MSYQDTDTQAAKLFYREIRQFAVTTQAWQTALYHQVLPDELWDLSTVSQRVYGRRDEFLVVLAAAGLGGFDEPLPQTVLVLPTEAQLYQIKRRCGFESMATQRNDGAPVWAA